MRKTFCFTALLMGMVTFCFTLVKSWEYVTQVIIASNRIAAVLDYWRKVMLLPGCAALAVTVGAVALLIRLRGKGTQPNGYAGILIGSGGLLALMAFLLAWNEYLQIKQLDFIFNLTSSVSYQQYSYVAGSDVESGLKLGFFVFF